MNSWSEPEYLSNSAKKMVQMHQNFHLTMIQIAHYQTFFFQLRCIDRRSAEKGSDSFHLFLLSRTSPLGQG